MSWFQRSVKEPGWLVLSVMDGRLRFVHGRFAAAGISEIGSFGATDIPAGAHGLEKAAREMEVDRFQCATLLTPGEYQMLQVEAPNVPQAELKSAIRWRIKDMLDYHVDDAVMDVLDIPPDSQLAGRSHSMYAVAARNDVIQANVKAFEEAKIPLSVIDIPETAQRNISALHQDNERGAALLYLDQEFGLLTITYQGELYLSRRIDIGFGQVKGRPADLRGELFGRIVLELQRTFDHFDRQFQYVTVSKLLLAPEPEDTGLFEHLQANLDMPVERVDLAASLNFRSGIPDAETQWSLFHLIGASLRHEAKVL